MGRCFCVNFEKEDIQQPALENQPFILNLDELELGFAQWLHNNKPQALECKAGPFFGNKGMMSFGHLCIAWVFSQSKHLGCRKKG
jgi:hypothetical protein